MRVSLKRRGSRIIIFSALLLALISLYGASPSYAVNGSVKQQILPLDCVYQIVNDGTGTIIFLTPEECGQIPDPEEPEEPEGPDPTPQPPQPTTPTVVTVVDSGTHVYQVPYVPTPSSPTPQTIVPGRQYLPYVPLANITADPPEATQKQPELVQSIAAAAPVIAVTSVALLLLLLLLLL